MLKHKTRVYPLLVKQFYSIFIDFSTIIKKIVVSEFSRCDVLGCFMSDFSPLASWLQK